MSSEPRPCRRSAAQIVFYAAESCLYLFGGQDENNDTLNDLWMFCLTKRRWSEVEQRGQIPPGRSGHTLNLHNNHLLLFGGILEVTKESNSLYVFDIFAQSWFTQKSSSTDLLAPGGDQISASAANIPSQRDSVGDINPSMSI